MYLIHRKKLKILILKNKIKKISLGIWLWLFFKVFFVLEYIKIMIFFKLFLKSTHLNDSKHTKKINV